MQFIRHGVQSNGYKDAQGTQNDKENSGTYTGITKDIETLNKNKLEMKNEISEMKNTLDGIKNSLDEVDDQISKLKEKVGKKHPVRKTK